MDELKPCPFCGKAVILHTDNSGWWGIKCSTERCFIWDQSEACYEEKDKQILIERWNTRPSPEAKGLRALDYDAVKLVISKLTWVNSDEKERNIAGAICRTFGTPSTEGLVEGIEKAIGLLDDWNDDIDAQVLSILRQALAKHKGEK